MAQIHFEINKQSYTFQCRDGEEERLTGLAHLVKDKVEDLVSSVGQIGESRLLVMAALLIADELREAERKLSEGGAAAAAAPAPAVMPSPAVDAPDYAPAFNSLADQMESLAVALETA